MAPPIRSYPMLEQPHPLFLRSGSLLRGGLPPIRRWEPAPTGTVPRHRQATVPVGYSPSDL